MLASLFASLFLLFNPPPAPPPQTGDPNGPSQEYLVALEACKDFDHPEQYRACMAGHGF